jgi:hypothetical protein
MGTVLPLAIQSIETVTTNDVQFSVGGCFDETDDGYRPVDCHKPHLGEAYLLLTHPDQLSYPGEEGLTDWAEPLCYARFDDYTGIDYQNSALDFGYLYPTAGGWTGGDREIVCYLYDPGGNDLDEPIGRASAA